MLKNAIYGLMVLITVGCATTPPRTGTVNLAAVVTKGFGTTDPVDVKQDVADHIGGLMVDKLREWIHQDTKLIVTSESPADYILQVRLDRVDPVTSGRYARTILGNFSAAMRTFHLEASGNLKKNGEQIAGVVFSAEAGPKLLDEALDDLCEEIANEIK